MDLLIVLFGFGVGILVGTTGVGGGSLMTPLLILAFHTKPTIAIGTDLAYAAVTKTVGGWRHLRKGTVDMTISLWLAVGSVPGALGGVYVLHVLEHALGRSPSTTSSSSSSPGRCSSPARRCWPARSSCPGRWRGSATRSTPWSAGTRAPRSPSAWPWASCSA